MFCTLNSSGAVAQAYGQERPGDPAVIEIPDDDARAVAFHALPTLFCVLGADGTIDHTYERPQPSKPEVVEIPAADPRAVAFLAGETPTQIARLKARLMQAVDDRAEDLRLTLITPGSGQAMEYQEVSTEAQAVLAWIDANPGKTIDPAPYPMLATSVGRNLDPATGQSTSDVAGEARAARAALGAYQQAGAAIRGVRLAGKDAVAAAATAAAAQAAFGAIAWPELPA